MTRTLVALAALAAFARAAAAQELRGVVRDSASGLPVHGAVIVVLDVRGGTMARDLSGTRGQFVLQRGPEAHRVRVLRLGYAPRLFDLPSPASGSVGLHVALLPLPTMLQGLRVTANTSCAPRTDRAEAMALLEQARAGLLAMVVAREANPARVTRIGFTRTMDPTGTRVEHQTIRLDSAADQTVSFDAVRTAREFVRDGFRALEGGHQTLYAPDADILVNESFARNYCFQLADADPARRNEVGLAFAPASRRRGRVDIDGALWIDTVRRVLVNIEFRYRGIEAQAELLGAGGHIAFHEVPTGVTVIDRWQLRLVGGPDSLLPPGANAGPVERAAIPMQRPFTVTETGGELARAVWRDSTTWVAALGTLQLSLTLPSGAVAAGIGVGLENTDYRAISDSAGRATFRDLLPGRYRLFVVDPLLVPLGIVLPTAMRYEARRGTTDLLTLAIPTAESFLAEVCGVKERAAGAAWLIARTVNGDGTPVSNARWRVRKSARGGWTTVTDGGRTGSTGLFYNCTALARGDHIEVQASRSGAPEQRIVMQLRDPVTVIPLTLPAMVAGRSGASGASRNSVALSGTVRDSITGAVIADARVSLAGTLLEAVTDSAGQFLLAGVPSGEYTVEVSSPWLDSIGAVKRSNVSATRDVSALALHVPSLSQLALATCGTPDVSGVVVGSVGMRGGEVLPGSLRVVAEWKDVALSGAGSVRIGAGAGNVARTRWLRTRSDSRGTFRLCGVPPGTALTLSTEPDSTLVGSAAPVSVEVDPNRRFARADLLLDRIARGALFTGTIVTDSLRQPIPHAEILLPELSRTAIADEQGAFRLRDIPAGTHVVLVRAFGYAPRTAQVEFTANRTVDHRITLSRVQTPEGLGAALPPLHSRHPSFSHFDELR